MFDNFIFLVNFRIFFSEFLIHARMEELTGFEMCVTTRLVAVFDNPSNQIGVQGFLMIIHTTHTRLFELYLNYTYCTSVHTCLRLLHFWKAL